MISQPIRILSKILHIIRNINVTSVHMGIPAKFIRSRLVLVIARLVNV